MCMAAIRVLASAVSAPDTIYKTPATVTSFEDFTEQIPGSGVTFRMIAVPGGHLPWGVRKMNRYGMQTKLQGR